MRAFSIAVGLIMVACLCAGMIDTNDYVTEKHSVVVQEGECLDIIAGRYYKQDERKISWDEFRHEVWAQNKKALHNGVLWAEDEIVVEVKKIAK